MQERDDPLSLHENDSEIGFTDQAPKWEQLYDEIEATRANKFDSLNTTKRTILLNRQDVFGKLMYLYGKDRNLLSYQIKVLLEDESGVGDGVTREVYSIFIEHLLQVAYEGREEFSPIILAEFGKEEYDVVGKILYHFFINFALFPVQFCEVSLQNAFIGQYSENTLIGSLLKFISRSDNLILSNVLMQNKFDYERIVDTLSRFAIRANPTKDNIRYLIIKAAKTELISKPSPAFRSLKDFRNFFKNFTGKHINSIYELSKPTNTKVLHYLNVFVPSNKLEEKVFDYLNRYIDESDKPTLEAFLRFCSGYAIIIPGIKILVTSKNMSEIEARPISKTCMKMLTIPHNMSSFHAFKAKMDFYLYHTELWCLED